MIPRFHYKYTDMDSQDSMPPPEASSPLAIGCEKCNLDEAPDKSVKIEITNMFMNFKEDMNKSFKEVCENTVERNNENFISRYEHRNSITKETPNKNKTRNENMEDGRQKSQR